MAGVWIVLARELNAQFRLGASGSYLGSDFPVWAPDFGVSEDTEYRSQIRNSSNLNGISAVELWFPPLANGAAEMPRVLETCRVLLETIPSTANAS